MLLLYNNFIKHILVYLVCLWGLELIYMVLGTEDYGLCEHSLFYFALLSQHHSMNIFNCVPVLCWSLCVPCDFYN